MEAGHAQELIQVAEQLERSARSQRAALCKARCGEQQQPPVAVNVGDDKAEAQAQSNPTTEFAQAGASLPLTVAFALPPSVRWLTKIDIVGARDENPFDFGGRLPQLADDVLIRMIGPEVKCPHMHEESKVIDGRNLRVQYVQGRFHDAISADED